MCVCVTGLRGGGRVCYGPTGRGTRTVCVLRIYGAVSVCYGSTGRGTRTGHASGTRNTCVSREGFGRRLSRDRTSVATQARTVRCATWTAQGDYLLDLPTT
eukprot:6902558-Prymnesium_polylepis.1